MRIGCDIDGVAGDFTLTWTRAYKTWFGKNPAPSAYTSWDGIVTGTCFSEEKHFFEWTDRANVWRDMIVVPGAQGALDRLSSLGHQITFITSRHESIQKVTEEWVKHHFGHLKADVKFAGIHKALVPCSVYIEDSPIVLEGLRRTGKTIVVFERHWNRGFIANNKDIESAKDWPGVLKILEGM